MLGLFLSLIFATAPVYVADVNGIIGPVTSEFMVHSVEVAEKNGAQLVIFRLDTPGGLDPSMRQIIKKILNADVPVCVYVAPSGARAASAGVFITVAAHIAAMAPGTNIGAAHPVTVGEKPDTVMMEKMTNDAVAYMKSLLRKRDRNIAWAEKFVRKSKSLPAEDAVDSGIVDLKADNLDELLKKIDGRKITLASGKEVTLKTSGAPIKNIKMSFRDKILAVVANPNVAYILLILGFYGLFFELSHPGAVVPGVIGAISIILAFYAFQTLPVNYAGILLILLAMILFIVEVKVQSHGLFALGGIISLFLGSLMLFQSTASFFKVSIPTIVGVVAITTFFFLYVVAKAVQALRRRAATGTEGMIGLIGEVTKKFKGNEITVLVHGEIWRAFSDVPLEVGQRVKVIGQRGLTLRVTPLEEEKPQ